MNEYIHCWHANGLGFVYEVSEGNDSHLDLESSSGIGDMQRVVGR
jgi:hypothetical protein